MSEQPRVRPDPEFALLEIYDAALPQVYGYLLARCRDATPAQDLTANVSCAACAWCTTRPSSSTNPWDAELDVLLRRGAEAVVDTVTEGQLLIVLAGEVRHAGVGQVRPAAGPAGRAAARAGRGGLSRACTALPIRFTVVSWPATSSRKAATGLFSTGMGPVEDSPWFVRQSWTITEPDQDVCA